MSELPQAQYDGTHTSVTRQVWQQYVVSSTLLGVAHSSVVDKVVHRLLGFVLGCAHQPPYQQLNAAKLNQSKGCCSAQLSLQVHQCSSDALA